MTLAPGTRLDRTVAIKILLSADLAQGTLVGNVVGVDSDCLPEINRLTLQKQMMSR